MGMCSDQTFTTEEAVESLINAVFQPNYMECINEWRVHFSQQYDPMEMSQVADYLTSLADRTLHVVNCLGFRLADGTFPYSFNHIENGLVYTRYFGQFVGAQSLGIKDSSTSL